MALWRRRTRRLWMHAGVVGVVLVMCVEVASVWVSAEVPLSRSDSLVLTRGVVGVVGGMRQAELRAEAVNTASSQEFGWWFERAGVFGVGWMVMPIWFAAVLIGAPTAWLWWGERRLRRAGLCAECGYDMRGLARGAKCPECGVAKPLR